MTDREYTEPTDEQLARFLVVYAPQILPGAESLALSPVVIQSLMSQNPTFKKAGLRHHRAFQEMIFDHTEKMERGGELQCEHIRPNGKKCPNRNEAGSLFCGLHKTEGE